MTVGGTGVLVFVGVKVNVLVGVKVFVGVLVLVGVFVGVVGCGIICKASTLALPSGLPEAALN